MNNRETVGVAKKKKEAKMIAAYKMYNLIVTRQLDLNAGPALDSPDEGFLNFELFKIFF